MKKSRLIVLLMAAFALSLLALPVMAQETAPVYDGFTRDEIMSAALTCDILAKSADGSYAGLTVAIPVDSGKLYPCEEVVGYEAGYTEPQIMDFSWMMHEPVYYALGASANVRVAPDADARLLGSVEPTTSPVVEVDAVYQVSQTEARLLIRSKTLTGWINNNDAKIDLAAGVEKPADWALDVMPDNLNNTAGGEPAGWSYPTIYSPSGDPITDVLRTVTDLSGHGRLLHGSDAHFVYPIRENGKYNPAVVYNGFNMRVEGDIWRYFENWQIGWPSGSAVPGNDKLPIVGEFLVKDAYEHALIKFAPAYVVLSITGRMKIFTQDEILAWPQTQTVLNAAVCPGEPVRLNVAGDYNGDTVNYDAAVGNHKCPSYLIGINADTPEGTIDILRLDAGTQPQEVYYLRDNTTFVMTPENISPEAMLSWLGANLPAIMTELDLADRTKANVSGVPGLSDGQVDVQSIGLAG